MSNDLRAAILRGGFEPVVLPKTNDVRAVVEAQHKRIAKERKRPARKRPTRKTLQQVHADLRADHDAWEAKKAYQNKYRRESGVTARYWAALKADPVRHAEELRKRRERRRKKHEREVGERCVR